MHTVESFPRLEENRFASSHPVNLRLFGSTEENEPSPGQQTLRCFRAVNRRDYETLQKKKQKTFLVTEVTARSKCSAPGNYYARDRRVTAFCSHTALGWRKDHGPREKWMVESVSNIKTRYQFHEFFVETISNRRRFDRRFITGRLYPPLRGPHSLPVRERVVDL